MSIVTVKDVVCDRCNFWAVTDTHTHTQTAARKAARRIGWVRRNGEDLCPSCQMEDTP